MRGCGWTGCLSPDLVTRRSSGIALQGTWPSLRAPTISTASKVPVWGCRYGVVVCLQRGLRPPWRTVFMVGTGEGPGLVCRTMIPRAIWQLWPSPGLRSGHGMEVSEKASQ